MKNFAYFFKGLSLALLFTLTTVSCSKGGDKPGQMPKKYSVDMVVTAPGMPAPSTMKMFVDDKLSRAEMEINGFKQVTIYRDNKVIMLMPDNKYMEMEVPNPTLNAIQSINDDSKWEKTGEEEINGISAIKWNVATKIKEQTINSVIWTDKKEGYPVRSEAQGAVIDWKNLKVGSQDKSLFEIPTGYSKMEMPQMPQ
ncbi:MAG: DUF4412 domain-containing protein [Verrucomicrobiia bacterium]